MKGHAVLEGLRHDLRLKCYFFLSMCKMVYLRILNVWPKFECDKRNAEVKRNSLLCKKAWVLNLVTNNVKYEITIYLTNWFNVFINTAVILSTEKSKICLKVIPRKHTCKQ